MLVHRMYGAVRGPPAIPRRQSATPRWPARQGGTENRDNRRDQGSPQDFDQERLLARVSSIS